MDIHNYLTKKWHSVKKCLGLLKSVFFFTELAFSSTLRSVNSLSCILVNNQKYKVRSQIVNVNSDEPVFFFILVLKQANAVVVVVQC